ncbi:MOZ/SAS family protein [Coccidioides posadasii C735 delta SOWgp]|uniref:Histone acetyltransferase n=1 Tax=Coccidioides posadasii (strain C735) TaxID=222929 RepID=C5PGA2_COCP7|nr:MOZ/SAS family protein [Coccidioides posadasii C735 delta SOWgp]EER23555.1 MOZ/SAS family protein [Coccidioides posadasii C735 delta SOWgp]|eukprot:XP_003065700.1 MOZ/SAS family protein [Coccidioides posadasii C735 delta SOWgp]
MAATMPAEYENATVEEDENMADSEQDAEGEDDVDMYHPLTAPGNFGGSEYVGTQHGLAELSAEPNHVNTVEETAQKVERTGALDSADINENNGDNERVRPVKYLPVDYKSESDADDAGDADPSFINEESESARDVVSNQSSDDDSEVDEDWEAESDDRDSADAEDLTLNNCIVCGQDEEHDPSEEFEEPLVCAVCGDHCHRQCAREQECLNDADDTDKWRCPSCVQNKLEADPGDRVEAHRRSIVSNIAKELLPAHSDALGPDSHSIFDNPILDDDPLDGSRSLRKRKASIDEVDNSRPLTRKRLRRTIDDQTDVAQANEDAGDRAPDNSNPSSRPSRPRRARRSQNGLCSVVLRQHGRLVLSFHLDREKLSNVLKSRPRSRTQRRRPPKPPVIPEEPPPPQFPPIISTPYTAPFYSFHEKEDHELNSKPYGGILADADADTSKTVPQQSDRDKFEVARQKAEEEWRQKILAAEQSGEGSPQASQKLSGPPSKMKCINFGGFEIETWYAAPYPEEYSRNRVLYICEFCLKYMNSDFVAWRHKLKCPVKHPPGDEIYRDGTISVFEVDGRKNPVYCQNLCLLAKLFLGSKTLYYDVEPFLFYVMTEYDELGFHFVGYFSKEKRPSSSNNVSCILTLPIHQRKGYGNLLIDFSYLLTRIERKVGSPEKPLSDMGLVSYRNYWHLVLSYQLRDQRTPTSIGELSERTGMTPDDVVSGLEGLRALVRDPVTKTYALRLNYTYFEEVIQNWEKKGYVQLNPDALVWTPYVMGRSNQSHYDRAPLHAVAPRDDHEEAIDDGDINPFENGNGLSGLNKQSTNHDCGATSGQNHVDSVPQFEAPGPPSMEVMSYGGQSMKHSNGYSTPSVTSTIPSANIPPTRFEIFPPIQSAAVKRRPGRPFGSTKKTRPNATNASPVRTSGRNTPRKNYNLTLATPTPAVRASPGLRRGRSKLLDNTLQTDGPADEPGYECVEPSNEDQDGSRSGAAGVGDEDTQLKVNGEIHFDGDNVQDGARDTNESKSTNGSVEACQGPETNLVTRVKDQRDNVSELESGDAAQQLTADILAASKIPTGKDGHTQNHPSHDERDTSQNGIGGERNFEAAPVSASAES